MAHPSYRLFLARHIGMLATEQNIMCTTPHLFRCLAVLATLSCFSLKAYPQSTLDLDGWSGFLLPVEVADVAFTEPGVIQAVNVKVGTFVNKGDVLGVLDDELQQSFLTIAAHQAETRGILESAVGEYELQLQRSEVFRALGPDAVASPHELARAEADLAVASGRLLAAREEMKLRELELEKAKLQLERRTLVAPFSGVVTEVYYSVGESVTPYEPKLVRLIRTNQLVAEINVSANEYRRIRNSRALRITPENGPRPVMATIQWMSPMIEGGSKTFKVRAIFDNPRGEFLAGDACVATYAPNRPGTALSPADTRSEF